MSPVVNSRLHKLFFAFSLASYFSLAGVVGVAALEMTDLLSKEEIVSTEKDDSLKDINFKKSQ